MTVSFTEIVSSTDLKGSQCSSLNTASTLASRLRLRHQITKFQGYHLLEGVSQHAQLLLITLPDLTRLPNCFILTTQIRSVFSGKLKSECMSTKTRIFIYNSSGASSSSKVSSSRCKDSNKKLSDNGNTNQFSPPLNIYFSNVLFNY